MTFVEGVPAPRIDAEAGAPGKRVAIVQSCYVPWKGYFDLINFVDEFILLDDRQYTRRDWRNRNRIKTAQGVQWLTIPVTTKGAFEQRIDETRIADQNWAAKHWKTVAQAYASASHFDDYRAVLEPLYASLDESYLSSINRRLLEALCSLLGIGTTLTSTSDYEPEGARSERLLSLCLQSGASVYISGPSAREYLDAGIFDDAGIEIQYMDYSGYRKYPQIHGPFEHAVSVLDLLFNVGSAAPRYMKSFSATSDGG